MSMKRWMRTRLLPAIVTICIAAGYYGGKELFANWAREYSQKAAQAAKETALRDVVDKAAREAARDAARKAAVDVQK